VNKTRGVKNVYDARKRQRVNIQLVRRDRLEYLSIPDYVLPTNGGGEACSHAHYARAIQLS
jgi:hypothetical protein